MGLYSINGSPSVSVIVIFLNAEQYFDEAIASVFGQTYTDWELLLVDDGSTDGSTALARAYAERYPGKVRYLEHEGHVNRGMSAARNLGIANARGTYIAFLDADDVWLPQRLERHVAILAASPRVDVVYGPTLYWYSWTGKPTDRERDHVGEIGVAPGTVVAPPALLTLFLSNNGRYRPGICSFLARRDVVRRIGGFEEAFRNLYEDQVFFAKMALNATVCVIDDCLDSYRQHPDSCVRMAVAAGGYRFYRRSVPQQRYLQWLEAYVAGCGERDAELLRALDAVLWPYRHPIAATVRELPLRLYYGSRLRIRKLLQRLLPEPAFERLHLRLRPPRHARAAHMPLDPETRTVRPLSSSSAIDAAPTHTGRAAGCAASARLGRAANRRSAG